MRKSGVFFVGTASTPLKSKPSFPQLRSSSTSLLNTSRFQSSSGSPRTGSPSAGVSGWTKAKTREEVEKGRKEKLLKRKESIKLEGGEDEDAKIVKVEVQLKLKLSEFIPEEEPVPVSSSS